MQAAPALYLHASEPERSKRSKPHHATQKATQKTSKTVQTALYVLRDLLPMTEIDHNDLQNRSKPFGPRSTYT